jgi:hypothetical protein
VRTERKRKASTESDEREDGKRDRKIKKYIARVHR